MMIFISRVISRRILLQLIILSHHVLLLSSNVIPQFLGLFASKAQTELAKPSAKYERATGQEYITHVAQVIFQIFDYMLVAEIIIRPASKISKEIKCLCLA